MVYVMIVIFVLAGLFCVWVIHSARSTVKKDRETDYSSTAPMQKRFERLDGQTVVAFRCNAYIEPNKEAAIKDRMHPGTVITDAQGQQYIVREYLKKYSNRNYIFNESKGVMYVVFALVPME